MASIGKPGGRFVMEHWCHDGTLVNAVEVERRRGTALGEIEPDSLVTITYAGVRWFLACVLELRSEDVSRVNRAMAGCMPMEQAIFWLRGHGAVRGLTPAQALQAGSIERVVEVAQAWAAERVPPGP